MFIFVPYDFHNQFQFYISCFDILIDDIIKYIAFYCHVKVWQMVRYSIMQNEKQSELLLI